MRALLRRLGSLKLAVVLLLALAGAMSAASLYESRHGTEAALRDFYGTRWFAAILAAMGVNALAALLLRWPFRKSQVGFVVAHVSILIILLGALITRTWSVDGRLWLRTEEVRSDFDGDGWVLLLGSSDGSRRAQVPIGADGPAFDPSERDSVDGVSWTIEQYAADTIDEGERAVADPNGPQMAAKVRIGHDQHQQELWVLDGPPERVGALEIRLLKVSNPKMLSQLLQSTSAPAALQRGRLIAELAGQRYVVDLATKIGQSVPLGQSGYRVRVLRYLPHAQVVERKVRSITSRPVNPMIEFELIDPAGKSDTHRLFARFPDQDFTAGHATGSAPSSQPVTFRYADATVLSGQQNMIGLLVDASGGLYARFTDSEGVVSSTKLLAGRPVGTPWQGTTLTLAEFLPRARSERALKPIPPRKGDVAPAAFVCLRASGQAHRLWIRKDESYDVHIGGKRVQVGYVPTRIPMGFSMKLLEPVITHYPGSERPRTYESRVLVDDASRNTKLERTISMNAPLKYGGYAFYQSSYQFDRMNRPIATVLSVVSDPGEPVVYVGYVGLVLGLIITLVQQVRRHRR